MNNNKHIIIIQTNSTACINDNDGRIVIKRGWFK